MMWYTDLVRVALTRRHIFWHSSALHRVNQLASAIERSMPEGCSLAFVDCRHPPLTREHDLDIEALAEHRANLIVLTNVDQLLRAKRGHAWLRQLRVPIMRLLDKGTAVLVASNAAKRSYPPVDGSSIATDCYQYIMRLDAYDLVRALPLEREHVEWVKRECAGSRALAAILLDSSRELSRKRRTALVSEELRRLVSAALLECGAEVLAWVQDEFLLKRQSSFRIDEISPDLYQTLSAAGLAEIDAATDTFRIFQHIHKAAAADSVIRANAAISETPAEWITAASLIFEFERLLRHIIDCHVRSHGHLRISTIGSYKDKILRNYKYDTGINEKNVDRVPLPWNWVDLSDLLDLAERFAAEGRIAGLTAAGWRRAHEDVLPFRNRIQHMRLPRPGEVERLRILVRELRLSINDEARRA